MGKCKTSEIEVKVVQSARGNPHLVDSRFMQCLQFLFIFCEGSLICNRSKLMIGTSFQTYALSHGVQKTVSKIVYIFVLRPLFLLERCVGFCCIVIAQTWVPIKESFGIEIQYETGDKFAHNVQCFLALALDVVFLMAFESIFQSLVAMFTSSFIGIAVLA